MKKRISTAIWGICFIVFGIGIVGNTLNWWDFTIFFKGWWTLFIIVPCAASVLASGITDGALIGLILGIMFLFANRGIITYELMWKLIAPIILIIAGIQLVFKNLLARNEADNTKVRTAKYFLSLLIALTCLGIFVSVIIFTDTDQFFSISTNETLSFIEEYSGIDNIEIYCNGVEVTVISGDIFQVSAVDIPNGYEVVIKGNTLIVGKNANSFPFSFSFMDNKNGMLEIMVPKDVVLQKFDVNSGSNKIYIENIQASNMSFDFGSSTSTIINCRADKAEISNGSGSSYFERVVFDNVNIESGSGKITMNSSDINGLKLNTGSGMFSFEGNLTGTCKMNTGSGNVALAMTGKLEDYYISGDSGSGGIWINGMKKENFNMGDKNSNNSIKVNTGSGRVSIEIK